MRNTITALKNVVTEYGDISGKHRAEFINIMCHRFQKYRYFIRTSKARIHRRIERIVFQFRPFRITGERFYFFCFERKIELRIVFKGIGNWPKHRKGASRKHLHGTSVYALCSSHSSNGHDERDREVYKPVLPTKVFLWGQSDFRWTNVTGIKQWKRCTILTLTNKYSAFLGTYPRNRF